MVIFEILNSLFEDDLATNKTLYRKIKDMHMWMLHVILVFSVKEFYRLTCQLVQDRVASYCHAHCNGLS